MTLTHAIIIDDGDNSEFLSLCGPLKVERNRSVIPQNHPKSLLHPGLFVLY